MALYCQYLQVIAVLQLFLIRFSITSDLVDAKQ